MIETTSYKFLHLFHFLSTSISQDIDTTIFSQHTYMYPKINVKLVGNFWCCLYLWRQKMRKFFSKLWLCRIDKSLFLRELLLEMTEWIIIITIIFDSDLESESRRIILNKSPKYLQLVIFPSFKIIFNNNRTSVDLQIESGPLSESQNI